MLRSELCARGLSVAPPLVSPAERARARRSYRGVTQQVAPRGVERVQRRRDTSGSACGEVERGCASSGGLRLAEAEGAE